MLAKAAVLYILVSHCILKCKTCAFSYPLMQGDTPTSSLVKMLSSELFLALRVTITIQTYSVT